LGEAGRLDLVSTRLLQSVLLLGLGLGLGLGVGAAQADKPDPAFEKRFAALKQERSVIKVEMKVSDDPERLPDSAKAGPVSVSGGRMGIYTPPVLSPEDMVVVVNQNMVEVRKCYKAQLAADPSWEDNLILDIAVKKTGRVSQVEIAPRRVSRQPIGECLMKAIPNWKFPEFTGELDGGISQEVVNGSIPVTFSAQ
jgi:hypothetical protein